MIWKLYGMVVELLIEICNKWKSNIELFFEMLVFVVTMFMLD